MGPVILHLARGSAGPAGRPLDRMVPALCCDDRLLNPGQKRLAFRQAQAQIREIAKITGAVDLHHVGAPGRTFDLGLHQAQNPPHP